MKYSQVKQIIEFCRGNLASQPDHREVIAHWGEDDFEVDSVRFIEEDAADHIWTESLIEQIKECYDLTEVPEFVEIDWKATAENCKVDGMGHHFNSYDGSEDKLLNYHVFDNRG